MLQRRYNTLSLLDYYLGHGRMRKGDINWNVNDPNVLTMTLPGGLDVATRVTRRSENEAPPDRLDTSEYFQQVRQMWLLYLEAWFGSPTAPCHCDSRLSTCIHGTSQYKKLSAVQPSWVWKGLCIAGKQALLAAVEGFKPSRSFWTPAAGSFALPQ